jgi:hypothetical protein
VTLIVYANKVMAADTSIWSGDIMVGEDEKIMRLPDGRLVGCTGQCAIIQPFMEWARSEFSVGAVHVPEGEHIEDFEAIVVNTDGSFYHYDHKIRPEFHRLPWIAIGTGVDFATGLLVAGFSAKKVVEEAIKRVCFVGGKVTTVRLGLVQEVPEETEVKPTWREERGLA